MLIEQLGRIWTIHRLDKDTSGIVIFALTPEAHRALSVLFEDRKVHKEYQAFILGELPVEQMTIEMPLRVNGDRSHRTIVDLSKGKSAETKIQMIESRNEYSLIAVYPKTGYTHQIRAHLAAIGHPILNDHLYGKAIASHPGIAPRLMLHACRLSFQHPILNQEVEINSPLPVEFATLLN